MSKRALVVWGGWGGHEPQQVAEIFSQQLVENQFEVELADNLDAFKRSADFDLIVPVWTMGTITPEQLKPLVDAVKSGVGIGGCHGGMCDSFRMSTEYQFMTGGQWVAHPGNDGVNYRVTITDADHYITRGLEDFDVSSEQYYMHVDPAIKVLASTSFPVADGPHVPNGTFEMPVSWTKYFGAGRVFYCSLGHQASVIALPPVLKMCTRGLLWAARGSIME